MILLGKGVEPNNPFSRRSSPEITAPEIRRRVTQFAACSLSTTPTRRMFFGIARSTLHANKNKNRQASMSSRTRWISTTLVVFALLAFGPATGLAAAQDLPASYSVTDAMVPTRDGVRLNTKIIAPEDSDEPLPIILLRTPYPDHRSRGTWLTRAAVAVMVITNCLGRGEAIIGSENVCSAVGSQRSISGNRQFSRPNVSNGRLSAHLMPVSNMSTTSANPVSGTVTVLVCCSG